MRSQRCGSPGNRTLNLRIKSLNYGPPLTCGFSRIPPLTCGLSFRLVPNVHGRFWLARGFFVGSACPQGLRLFDGNHNIIERVERARGRGSECKGRASLCARNFVAGRHARCLVRGLTHPVTELELQSS